jgi:hypothetical protein
LKADKGRPLLLIVYPDGSMDLRLPEAATGKELKGKYPLRQSRPRSPGCNWERIERVGAGRVRVEVEGGSLQLGKN